jgi:malonate-semialdehyde dehydrogenase (acetylating) / methylmalonate-semialdehyde dehydrogenase
MSEAEQSSAFSFDAGGYDFTPYVPCRNFIAGQWRDAADGDVLAVENPRHGERIGDVAVSGAADVEAAVSAAKAGAVTWAATPIKERAAVLYRLKKLMERDLEELSWLLSHENGKTFAQAKGSILKGIECLEFAVAVPNGLPGGILEVSRGVTCSVRYEPLGVVGCIVPFNFPTMVPMWTVPLALIAGNAVILKPSEKVPYGMLRLAAHLQEAGLPDGVFNTVNGTQKAVEAIVDHPDVKAVSFVGSTRVAEVVYRRGTALGKRMLCLGGAKNHLVMVPDADVEMTATNVVASSMGCAGQRCMSASVMVAVGDCDHIIDAIVQKARKIEVGTGMGAIIDGASVRRIHDYIDAAQARGATVLVDGRGAMVDGGRGHWVGPTILDHVTTDMSTYRDEVFGPVLSIVRTSTLDEAIAIENAHEYGNGACIYTTNGGTAEYASLRFEAGMIGVNIGVPVPREPFSFGGWNRSKFGHGDITGADGYRFWTRPRKITTKWALQKNADWMS